MNQYHYKAHGKLLITAEYAVLNGAKALAVPVQYLQEMTVTCGDSHGKPMIHWKALDRGIPWFEATFSLPSFNVVSTVDHEKSLYLKKILSLASRFNPDFIRTSCTFEVTTNTSFNRQWGLGTSSSLTALVAQWAGIDAMKLHFASSSGSGYDVACALADGPLLYQLSASNYSIEPVLFNPPFSSNIFFIYLGSKQSTTASLQYISSGRKFSARAVDEISEITNDLLNCQNPANFNTLLRSHEAIVSDFLERRPIGEERFPGFQGTVKSLGAWGGDFAMVLWDGPAEDLLEYMSQKEIQVVIPFDRMVLQNHHSAV